MNLVIPRFRGSKRQWLLKSWFSKETRQTKMTGSRKALAAIFDPSPPCPGFETPSTMWVIWEHGAAARWWRSAQQLSYGSPKHCSEIFWVYVTNETADQISRDHVSPQWALTKIKDSLILPSQVHDTAIVTSSTKQSIKPGVVEFKAAWLYSEILKIETK